MYTRLLRYNLNRTHISLTQMNSFSKLISVILNLLKLNSKALTNNKAIKMYNLVIRSSTTITTKLFVYSERKKLIT